jgi:hypothetical protein
MRKKLVFDLYEPIPFFELFQNHKMDENEDLRLKLNTWERREDKKSEGEPDVAGLCSEAKAGTPAAISLQDALNER